ncbi:helix-turn-helix domain-containing protein [Galbibacter sp. CMA-7]|uniref:Helix-turn-helix domain-containing protein n=2 Tax=Galbibacter pacificus TaxID=2996052 RepID=A0ABT6FMR5_9FLAO|nr:helix-turn-helix domain-containing protein [Galbibacter pacificus]MDG3581076.1 helix-turn-helix domain-containing protein [Galbibacter pacificus]MDG3584554.1 helix-turn-helix domain-containing protein [Galbibacter pacificus]
MDKKSLSEDCLRNLRGIKDTQDLLSGKWKTSIIGALYHNGKFRFMELKRHIDGIAPKVLSKELKDLEMNRLITRKVRDTMPITVEYELTPQGKSLNKVINAMGEWGVRYRELMMKK